MIEPRVRGAAYLSATEYIVDRFGGGELERVLATLAPADRAAVEAPIAADG